MTTQHLSPAAFDDVLFNLSAFGTASALRQVELHRAAGDFDGATCDRLAAAVVNHPIYLR